MTNAPDPTPIPTPNVKVLKHLAQQYDTDTYKLRQLLRKQFKPNGGRWKWDLDNKTQAEQYQSVQTYLTDCLSPSKPKDTNTSTSTKTTARSSRSTQSTDAGQQLSKKRSRSKPSSVKSTSALKKELKELGLK